MTSRTSSRLGYGLALWSVGFAVVHVAWALGWRGGVPDDAAPIADRPVFLAYDVVAAVLMVGAAYVAVRLGRGGLVRRTRSRLLLATVVGSAAALLRGVPALAIDVTTGTYTGVGLVADVWFTVAGAAGLALWWRERPVTPVGPGASRRGTPAPGRRPPAAGAR